MPCLVLIRGFKLNRTNIRHYILNFDHFNSLWSFWFLLLSDEVNYVLLCSYSPSGLKVPSQPLCLPVEV